MVTLYNVVSSDGYIARKDGKEDFISDNLWQNFLDLCKKYDALVMGRKTYDAMQKYSRKLLDPFEALDIFKIVVTHDKKFHPDFRAGYVVASTPQDALSLRPNTLVSSGPTLNMDLLRNSFVDKIILHEVPVAIGDGIKPFEMKNDAYALILSKRPELLKGVKVYEYRVIGVQAN